MVLSSFKPNLVQEVLESIPPVINPKKNKNWKFIESYSSVNNALVWETNQYGFEQTKYITGVCPNGKGFIKDLTDTIRKRSCLILSPENN